MKEICDGHEADKRRHGRLTINGDCKRLGRRVTSKNLAMEMPCYCTCMRLWETQQPFLVELEQILSLGIKIGFFFKCVL